ncbi:MAG: VOC family protein [Asgard group archaeon]|nr:VOC family protein [Asgard group archaeon]
MKNINSTITFLQTDKLEETTAFYEEILSCPMVVDQGLCRIFQITQESYIGFCKHEFLEENEDTVCVTFVFSTKKEVDKWYEYLKKKEVKIKSPPKETKRFQIYNFFAMDPNGISIEFQTFLHPFPPE